MSDDDSSTITTTVSNGFGQCHLSLLAAELAERGLLRGYISAANLPHDSRLNQFLRSTLGPRGTRLADRAIDVGAARRATAWFPEIYHQLSQRARSRGESARAERLATRAAAGYARVASRALSDGRSDSAVFHFRAGFGGESLVRARANGMLVVCDHSIAHPDVLRELARRFDPDHRTFLKMQWDRVESDLYESDVVVVNSHYVRATCVAAGMDESRIRVAHLPLEQSSIDAAEEQRTSTAGFDPDTVAFVGTLEMRKGIDVFFEAAAADAGSERRWVTVGAWAADAQHLAALSPSNVTHLGKLSRVGLSRFLARRPIVVFPTRAEGSARTVAEALGSGCHVITTPNAGSILRDGVDGALIPADDPMALLRALELYLRWDTEERRIRSEATMAFAQTTLTTENYVKAVIGAYQGTVIE